MLFKYRRTKLHFCENWFTKSGLFAALSLLLTSALEASSSTIDDAIDEIIVSDTFDNVYYRYAELKRELAQSRNAIQAKVEQTGDTSLWQQWRGDNADLFAELDGLAVAIQAELAEPNTETSVAKAYREALAEVLAEASNLRQSRQAIQDAAKALSPEEAQELRDQWRADRAEQLETLKQLRAKLLQLPKP